MAFFDHLGNLMVEGGEFDYTVKRNILVGEDVCDLISVRGLSYLSIHEEYENELDDDMSFKFDIEHEFWYSNSSSILLMLGAFILLLISPAVIMWWRGTFCFYKS